VAILPTTKKTRASNSFFIVCVKLCYVFIYGKGKVNQYLIIDLSCRNIFRFNALNPYD
jgi:hypothetical protein